jgi:hypothetical protein
MEPITREEYYLAKIAGTYKGKTPEPVTIDEYYLATMAGDYSGNTPQPVTRLQYYMAKVAGVWGGSIPAPVTRLEYYWAAIASGEGKVFPPVTREEHFLVLVADAYSVVLTVVTGNPALLENSKGNRGLESLTLYGKSTQVSTTGAQLLPFEVGEKREGLEVFKDGIAISGARENDIYAVGRSGMGNESSYDDFPLLASGEYYVYSDSASVNLFVVAFRNGINITLGSSMKGVAAKIKVMDGDKFRIFLRLEEAFNGKVKAMISKTQPTASNYEPYTGGKPSPSPEYPQEIESAGKSGKIGVTVTGTNLLPFEVGQKGNGFEAFADGVQIDTDRNVNIYAVGRNDSLVESGYDEFALMTAGKYYIYSDTRDVYLYVVVWRKGRNVVFGSSNEGVARQIEIMDGDKFRIFFRTAAAFKGKVKAMITRIPMNATSYEPYKPAQTLIIPTPNGLPGVPTIDNGNYTDASGQQWLCDEVDLKRGVYVQNVAFAEFGKGITSLTKNSGVSSKNIVSAYFFSIPRKRAKTRHTIMSNCLRFVESISSGNPAYVISNESQTEAMYVSIPAELYENDDQMLNLLAEKKVKILYATYPTERPLSTEELEKYRSLRTYSPTTTVINDAEAGMSVGYAKMK